MDSFKKWVVFRWNSAFYSLKGFFYSDDSFFYPGIFFFSTHSASLQLFHFKMQSLCRHWGEKTCFGKFSVDTPGLTWGLRQSWRRGKRADFSAVCHKTFTYWFSRREACTERTIKTTNMNSPMERQVMKRGRVGKEKIRGTVAPAKGTK